MYATFPLRKFGTRAKVLLLAPFLFYCFWSIQVSNRKGSDRKELESDEKESYGKSSQPIILVSIWNENNKDDGSKLRRTLESLRMEIPELAQSGVAVKVLVSTEVH